VSRASNRRRGRDRRGAMLGDDMSSSLRNLDARPPHGSVTAVV